MYPILIPGMVDYDREHRHGVRRMRDPDELYSFDERLSPDPVGRVFTRFVDWVSHRISAAGSGISRQARVDGSVEAYDSKIPDLVIPTPGKDRAP